MLRENNLADIQQIKLKPNLDMFVVKRNNSDLLNNLQVYKINHSNKNKSISIKDSKGLLSKNSNSDNLSYDSNTNNNFQVENIIREDNNKIPILTKMNNNTRSVQTNTISTNKLGNQIRKVKKKEINNYKKLSNDTNKFTQFANFTREHNILKLSHKNSSYGSLENSNTFHSGSLGII